MVRAGVFRGVGVGSRSRFVFGFVLFAIDCVFGSKSYLGIGWLAYIVYIVSTDFIRTRDSAQSSRGFLAKSRRRFGELFPGNTRLVSPLLGSVVGRIRLHFPPCHIFPGILGDARGPISYSPIPCIDKRKTSPTFPRRDGR